MAKVIGFEVGRRICDVLGIENVSDIDIHIGADEIVTMKLRVIPDRDKVDEIVNILLEAEWK